MASMMRQAGRIVSRNPRLYNPGRRRPCIQARCYSNSPPLQSSMRPLFYSVVGGAAAMGCGYYLGLDGESGNANYRALLAGINKSISNNVTRLRVLDTSSESDPSINKKYEVPTMATVIEEDLEKAMAKPHTCRNVRYQVRVGTQVLSPKDVDLVFKENSESFHCLSGSGVVRYDRTQVASNDPVEDDYSEGFQHREDGDWHFWGIYDGHSGYATSATLRNALIPCVYNTLAALPEPDMSDPETVDKAIQAAFCKLDDEIVLKNVEKVTELKSRSYAAHMMAPAIAGSCAILSFYDTKSQLLHVACTGDSRAVLGRLEPNGLYSATPLSVDQTGDNKDEEARLILEHPGEEGIIKNGRIFGGIQITRAFGDASYKWAKKKSYQLRKEFWATFPNAKIATAPYMTAEPVITRTKIQPENGDFVVMATDGLWEMLTNEEVVGLVGKYIQNEKEGKPSMAKSWMDYFSGASVKLPVIVGEGVDKLEGEIEVDKRITRPSQWRMKRDLSRFMFVDDNVATHLMRNAYGGNNADLVAGLLALPTPTCRRFRDDVTITVIFFGEGKNESRTLTVADGQVKDTKL